MEKAKGKAMTLPGRLAGTASKRDAEAKETGTVVRKEGPGQKSALSHKVGRLSVTEGFLHKRVGVLLGTWAAGPTSHRGGFVAFSRWP